MDDPIAIARRLAESIDARFPGRGGRRRAAAAMGCQEAYLSGVLGGKKRPRIVTYARFAEFLGVPLERILGIAASPSPTGTSPTGTSRILPFLGTVAAGLHAIGRGDPAGGTYDPEAGYPPGAFALRVAGRGADGAGICDGDVLVVAPAPGPVDGRLLIVRGDSGYTLLGSSGGRLYAFLAEGRAPAEIPVPAAADARIVGVVVERSGGVVFRPGVGDPARRL